VQNKNFLSLEEEQIDFKAVFDSLRQHWYYFAIAIPIFLLGAYFYIKSVEPIYEVNTTVIIDDGSSTTVNAADFFSEDVGGQYGQSRHPTVGFRCFLLQERCLCR
jgi:uncharacterized protein involved in exopolysaccharide biosynthesis